MSEDTKTRTGPLIYTNEDGREIPYRAVHESFLARIATRIRREYEEREEQVDAPAYKVGKDSFYHDEDSIADESTTDEEKAAWAAYLDCQDRMANEITLKQTKAMIVRAVQLDVPDDWIEMQEAFGADLPENAIDLKYEYLQDECFYTAADWIGFMAAVRTASIRGISQEAVETFETFFRGTLDRIGRSVAERVQGTIKSETSKMDASPEI